LGLRERGANLLARAPTARHLARASRWRGVLVLCYHRIGASVSGAAWSASRDAFDGQVELLRRRFEIVAPSQVLRAARARRGRFAAITFDDGFRDGYDVALPVLRGHDAPAGFFVTTGFLDRGGVPWWDEIAYRARRCTPRVLDDPSWLEEPVVLAATGDRTVAVQSLLRSYKRLDGERTAAFLEYLRGATGNERVGPADAGSSWLTWEMVREMREAGMEIGGHTVNHPVLTSQPPEVQRAEIEGCATRLETELGEPMRLFSYPVGLPTSFDATTRAIVSSVGVDLAFSCYGGATTRRALDPLDIRRMPIGPGMTPERFQALLELPSLFARV